LKDEVLLTRNTTKGGKQRLIYLASLASKDVRKSLSEYINERRTAEAIPVHPESPLFKSRMGGAFTPNTMQMLFKRLFVAAGLDQGN
jgi:integrase/recombinase XerD